MQGAGYRQGAHDTREECVDSDPPARSPQKRRRDAEGCVALNESSSLRPERSAKFARHRWRPVRVIHTNEAFMIARSVATVLSTGCAVMPPAAPMRLQTHREQE